MRGNHLEQIPAARWETTEGWAERLDADTIKITVQGRTAAPRSQRVGFTVVILEKLPHDYRRKMDRLVRELDKTGLIV